MSRYKFQSSFSKKYSSRDQRLLYSGFKDFFYDVYIELGDETFRNFLEKLGYNSSLFCTFSRNFNLSIHSSSKVKSQVRNAVSENMFY